MTTLKGEKCFVIFITLRSHDLVKFQQHEMKALVNRDAKFNQLGNGLKHLPTPIIIYKMHINIMIIT